MSIRKHISFLALLFVFPAAGWSQTAAAASVPPNPPLAGLSQDQIHQLITRAADRDLENDKQQRDYTYVQREEQRKLDGQGEVKSTETKTYEVMELYGEQVQRLIAKDDKPLSEKDSAKEEEKIQKSPTNARTKVTISVGSVWKKRSTTAKRIASS